MMKRGFLILLVGAFNNDVLPLWEKRETERKRECVPRFALKMTENELQLLRCFSGAAS